MSEENMDEHEQSADFGKETQLTSDRLTEYESEFGPESGPELEPSAGSAASDPDGYQGVSTDSQADLDGSRSDSVSFQSGREGSPVASDGLEDVDALDSAVTVGDSDTVEDSDAGVSAFSEGDVLGALEAILMVVPEPVSVRHLSDVLGISQAEIDGHLRALAAEYRGDNGRPRGFELREAGEGWRIYSSPRYAEVVGAFVTAGQTSKLSGPALETLAVIAYRQPVTRSQIAEIRGVNVDGVVRTLMTRGLIEATGQEGTGAVLYGTTEYFLEKMGMTSLAELPPASPHLPELDELDDIEKDRQ